MVILLLHDWDNLAGKVKEYMLEIHRTYKAGSQQWFNIGHSE